MLFHRRRSRLATSSRWRSRATRDAVLKAEAMLRPQYSASASWPRCATRPITRFPSRTSITGKFDGTRIFDTALAKASASSCASTEATEATLSLSSRIWLPPLEPFAGLRSHHWYAVIQSFVPFGETLPVRLLQRRKKIPGLRPIGYCGEVPL
jgi:hypothetical protein